MRSDPCANGVIQPDRCRNSLRTAAQHSVAAVTPPLGAIGGVTLWHQTWLIQHALPRRCRAAERHIRYAPSAMSIITPQLLALDTSILARWAHDAYSPIAEAQRASANALHLLFSSDWLPVLSWHQVEELLCHADSDVCSNRMRFLSSLPHVAWVRSCAGIPSLGSIVDLLATELEVLSSLGNISQSAFRIAVRERLYRFGEVSHLAPLACWRDLRPHLLESQAHGRETASISHVKDRDSDTAVLQNLDQMTPLPNSAADRLFAQQSRDLEQHLSARGDRRLQDPATVAQAFTSDVSALFRRVRDADPSHVKALLSEFDVPEEDIDDSTTLDEFAEMAANRTRIRVACRSLGCDLDEIWPRLRGTDIPSQIIQARLRSTQKSAPTASGSDITDVHLASFSPYVDCVVVDKRTHEYLSQAARRDDFIASLIERYVRLSSYRDIGAVIDPAHNKPLRTDQQQLS